MAMNKGGTLENGVSLRRGTEPSWMHEVSPLIT